MIYNVKTGSFFMSSFNVLWCKKDGDVARHRCKGEVLWAAVNKTALKRVDRSGKYTYTIHHDTIRTMSQPEMIKSRIYKRDTQSSCYQADQCFSDILFGLSAASGSKVSGIVWAEAMYLLGSAGGKCASSVYNILD